MFAADSDFLRTMDRRSSQAGSEFIAADLLHMQQAPNYNNWMLSMILPHLGKRILEIGSGVGTMTTRLLERAEIVCALEPNPYCASRLKADLDKDPRLAVINKPLEECTAGELSAYGFDTVLCCNVLEHISDDLQALIMFRKILAGQKGKAIIWVPAVPLAYGSIDKAVGHYRRYSRGGILALVRAAGMQPIVSRYINLLGLLGWIVNSHVFHRVEQSNSQIGLFNRLVPFLAKAEKLIPPPVGMSLLVVAEAK